MFALSAMGLRNIPVRDYHVQRFVFVLGDVEFETTNLCADFVSLKLARLHRDNPEMDRFELAGVEASDVSALLSLCHGDSVMVCEKNREALLGLARQLEIRELYVFLQKLYPEELSLDNAIDRLVLKSSMEIECDEEVGFVAAHLFEWPSHALASVPVSVLNSVMSSSSIKEKSDKMFELVEFLCTRNANFFPLFEHVKFEQLPVDSMSRFIRICERVDVHMTLDSGVWKAVCKRLLMNVGGAAQGNAATSTGTGICIRFSEAAPLNGIVSFMTQKYGGNVHKANAITVTASSYYSIRYPTNIVDLAHEEYFYSKNEPNQWIQYEFKTGTVSVESYTLKTRQYGGGYHIRSWVVETSVNGDIWDELDNQDNMDDMAEEGCVKSFHVKKPSSYARFIRIRQTGHNSNGSNIMTLARFEIFGTFVED